MANQEGLRKPKTHHLAYVFLWLIIRVGFSVFGKLTIIGEKNLPREGAVVIASNHLHAIDPPLIYGCTTRWLYGLGAASHQDDWLWGVVMKVARAVFINRGEFDRAALKMAMNVLEDGHPLVVPVEGTRSTTGGLQQGKTGAAYLASRTNALIVPVAAWGMENFFSSIKHFKRAEVVVVFGEPFTLPEGRARSAQLEQYTEQIMTTIASMLPESYRGVYAEHPLTIEKLAAKEVGQRA